MKHSYSIGAHGKAMLGATIAAAILIGGGAAYRIYAQQKTPAESKEAQTTSPSKSDTGSTSVGNGKAVLGFAATPRQGAETKRILKKDDIRTTQVETILRPETLRLTVIALHRVEIMPIARPFVM
ncbi:MAG: hypothetical protein NTX50_21385 [Candidatus Sumerlaeota bacterium]|nr:hypothetical protein [Candidatus Sumerlaeota bacterium]